MKTFKKRKFFGFAFFFSIIFALHILNFHNLATNSLLQLNGENSHNVLIDHAQKVDVLSNKSGGFFVLSEDNSSSKISFLDKNCIESNTAIVSTQINSKYLDAKIISNDIYLLTINDENKRQIIRLSFSEGSFCDDPISFFQLPNESSVNSFYVADNALFFVENGAVFGFTIEESSNAINLLSQVNSIFLNFNCDYLYVVKEDSSISICSIEELKTSIANETTPNFIDLTLSESVDLKNNPVNFLSDDLFMSSTGQLFKINLNQAVPSGISKVFTLDVSEISIFNCSTILNFESKDYLFCKTSTNNAHLFDLADNFSKKHIVSLNENLNIFSICSSDSNTLLVYKDSDNKYFAKLISEDDISEIENTDPNQNNPENPNDPGNSQNPNGNENDKLLGDYTTDSENKYILGVKLGTTVAAFKQNLNLNGEYTLSFKNYSGKEITSGKLGTGSVVTFWKDNHIFKEYTLVVDYDVTGEGNFNSRDLDYLYNEIFKNGKTNLSGEYFYSGDTNHDGQIDTLDLLKMKKTLN